MGAPPHKVGQVRAALGIPLAHNRVHKHNWRVTVAFFKRMQAVLLAEAPDLGDAEMTQWPIDWEVLAPLLGEITDAALGALLGCPSGTVSRERCARGISGATRRETVFTTAEFMHAIRWARVSGLAKFEVAPLDGVHRPSAPWALIEPLFGQMRNGNIAWLCGLCTKSIVAHRAQRDGPAFDAGRAQVLEAIRPMLGRATDVALGRWSGLGLKTIATMRRAEGIAPHGSATTPPITDGNRRRLGRAVNRTGQIDWRYLQLLLGLLPDPQIAKMLECSTQAVNRKRRALGIPTYDPRDLDWSIVDHLLGAVPDAEAARRMSCPVRLIRERREAQGVAAYRIPVFDLDGAVPESLLGTMSDQALATRFNTTRARVRNARRRAGIKAHGRQAGMDYTTMDPLLGTMPDQALADQIGCNPRTIFLRRKALGVISFRQRRRR